MAQHWLCFGQLLGGNKGSAWVLEVLPLPGTWFGVQADSRAGVTPARRLQILPGIVLSRGNPVQEGDEITVRGGQPLVCHIRRHLAPVAAIHALNG